MSDTPRTDAVVSTWGTGNQVLLDFVSANFARELERENRAQAEEIARLRSAMEGLDRYMRGDPCYDHGVMDGNGDENSLTPAKVVRAALTPAQPTATPATNHIPPEQKFANYGGG